MKTYKGQEEPKEMVGGCCVCSDENGWTENPLVYCDGQGCNVAVHQACYGIVAVPTGSWYCRKCESTDKNARMQRCELCPSRSGALKRTDSGGWAHVVCALYIPEVRFGNVTTMEPIMLQLIPQERFNKTCCICEEKGKASKANIGACMQCNKPGCKQNFHVICAQAEGLLCEEAGNYLDNVKYCGYCQYHYSRIRKGAHVKSIPPYRPVSFDESSDGETSNGGESKEMKLRKRLKCFPPIPEPGTTGSMREDSHSSTIVSSSLKQPVVPDASAATEAGKASTKSIAPIAVTSSAPSKTESAADACNFQVPNSPPLLTSSTKISVTAITSTSPVVSASAPIKASAMMPLASASTTSTSIISTASRGLLLANRSTTPPSTQSGSVSNSTLAALASSSSTTQSIIVSSRRSTPPKSEPSPHVGLLTTVADTFVEKNRKSKRSGQRTPPTAQTRSPTRDSPKDAAPLVICEEKPHEEVTTAGKSGKRAHSPEQKLNIQYTTNMSAVPAKQDNFGISHAELTSTPSKKPRTSSQERGRRTKRGAPSKRGRMASYKESSLKLNRDSDGSSPDSFTSEIMPVSKRGRGKKSELKEACGSIITNGVGATTLLLGNQINPSSAVAQKMTDTLSEEIQAHSIYKEEERALGVASLIGPCLPGKKDNSFTGSVLGSSQPPPLPQSLEQLLERQWEQGSQFLMEQAQHFDIASLLSCLHQLRQENVRLEETVTTLIARRDHLLAVNARLSVPLTSSNHSYPSTQSTVSSPSAPSGHSSTTAHASAIVNSAILTSRSHPTHRHPSGGGVSSGGGHSNVPRGNTSPHDRRISQQAVPSHPIENGLPESDCRYRQTVGSVVTNSEFQHRQQSPMLPPGVQQSPNSIRQSPAGSSYHSSSSPHTGGGVPSLSPSGVAAPPHSLVGHGHPPIMVSNHGHVSLNRIPDHSRAELVRLNSAPQPSPIMQHSSGGAYPVYQMVSPPVAPPGSHHSPVGLSQHPSHPQVIRRDVESNRGSHSSADKR